MIACGGCLQWMLGPTEVDDDGRELCGECAPWLCLFCRRFLPPDDRLPLKNGDAEGHIHCTCGLRVSNALKLQQSSTAAQRAPRVAS